MNDSIFFELEEEKEKILKMVEEKKISAEEADRLINILEESVLKEEAQEQNRYKGKQENNYEDASCKKKIKIPNVKGKLIIQVFENGIKKVNIQLPIALVKIAEKFPIQSIQTDSEIPISEILKTAKENGLNIEQGMYVLIEDKEVHIYDADGVEFVSVKE